MVTWQLMITILYLRAMKAFQYFEYYRHRNSVLLMSAISFLAIGNTVFETAFYAEYAACELTDYGYDQSVLERNRDFTPYCYDLHIWTSASEALEENKAIVLFLVSEVLAILPYFFFFLYLSLMRPHDCFECFNRLPGTRYSIFQYTKQELNALYRYKMGEEVAKRFEEDI